MKTTKQVALEAFMKTRGTNVLLDIDERIRDAFETGYRTRDNEIKHLPYETVSKQQGKEFEKFYAEKYEPYVFDYSSANIARRFFEAGWQAHARTSSIIHQTTADTERRHRALFDYHHFRNKDLGARGRWAEICDYFYAGWDAKAKDLIELGHGSCFK